MHGRYHWLGAWHPAPHLRPLGQPRPQRVNVIYAPWIRGALAEDPTGVQGEVEVGGEAEFDPGLISGLETGLCGCGGGVGVWGRNRGFDSLDLRWDAIMSLK